MPVRVAINDLSLIQFRCLKDAEDALKRFLEALQEILRRDNVRNAQNIYGEVKRIEFMDQFSKRLYEPLTSNDRTTLYDLLSRLCSNHTKDALDWMPMTLLLYYCYQPPQIQEETLNQIPPFVMRNKKSKICAWAQKGFVVSLESDSAFAQDCNEGQISQTSGNISIRNLSRLSHVRQYEVALGRRTFVPSPKHKSGGWGSPMDLDDAQSQELLESAVRDRNAPNSSALYAKKDGKYYVFRVTGPGTYHGYWDENLPQNNLSLCLRLDKLFQ